MTPPSFRDLAAAIGAAPEVTLTRPHLRPHIGHDRARRDSGTEKASIEAALTNLHRR
jgi:hypothetical protein